MRERRSLRSKRSLAARGQQLAFEPPDWSALLGSAHSGTLGGLVACNLSGPRRLKSGAVRDHILGFRGVTGGGDIFKAGARVVKNVTGYDLPKLLTGSYGTLAALTSVILKVLPAPETEETVVLTGLDDAAAVTAMSLAMQSLLRGFGRRPYAGRGHLSPARRHRAVGLPTAATRWRSCWRAGGGHGRQKLGRHLALASATAQCLRKTRATRCGAFPLHRRTRPASSVH